MTLVFTMQSVTTTVRAVEAALNRALSEYETSTSEDGREFFILKIQVLIFKYDVVSGLASLGLNRPTGFAQAVALKSLVHNLYEYDSQMNRTLIPRILRYATKRNKPVDTSLIKTEKTKWRDELKMVRNWKPIRDGATGHYGHDVGQQIQLLNTIRQEDVLSVVSASIHYGTFVLSLLPHKKRSEAS